MRNIVSMALLSGTLAAASCATTTPAPQVAGAQIAVMKRVEFEPGSAELSASSKATLDQAAGAIKAEPTVREIRLEGRTDNTGTEKLNDQLARQRADAVQSYLRDQGLPSDKVHVEALGEALPVASNSIPEGRALNRSVTIVATN